MPSVPPATFNAPARQTDLLQALNDPRCVLPCLLGITPGQTTSAEAQSLLLALGIQSRRFQLDDGRIVYYSKFDFPDGPVRQGLEIFDWDDRVDTLHAGAESSLNEAALKVVWARYAPDRLAAAFGAPSRVLVTFTQLGRDPATSSEAYDLWVFYDDLHFVAAYSGLAARRGDGYEVCPVYREVGNLSFYFNLYVNHAESLQTLEALIGISLQMPAPAQPIQEVADLEPAEFATLLISTEVEPCFLAKPNA